MHSRSLSICFVTLLSFFLSTTTSFLPCCTAPSVYKPFAVALSFLFFLSCHSHHSSFGRLFAFPRRACLPTYNILASRPSSAHAFRLPPSAVAQYRVLPLKRPFLGSRSSCYFQRRPETVYPLAYFSPSVLHPSHHKANSADDLVTTSTTRSTNATQRILNLSSQVSLRKLITLRLWSQVQLCFSSSL